MLERPFGKIELHHRADPSRRVFWPGWRAWVPAVTTISPVSSPLAMATVAGLWRSTSTFRSDTVRFDGSTTQTAGRRSNSVRAVAGISMVGAVSSCTTSDDGSAEAHGRGRIGQPDLDLERPGDGIGLRRDLPDTPDGRHGRIVRQAYLDERIARGRPQHLARHIEHGVSPAFRGHANDQLSSLDHFAGLGCGADHDSAGIRLQLGVAHLILGDLLLRLRGIRAGHAAVSRVCSARSY